MYAQRPIRLEDIPGMEHRMQFLGICLLTEIKEYPSPYWINSLNMIILLAVITLPNWILYLDSISINVISAPVERPGNDHISAIQHIGSNGKRMLKGERWIGVLRKKAPFCGNNDSHGFHRHFKILNIHIICNIDYSKSQINGSAFQFLIKINLIRKGDTEVHVAV